MTRTIIIILLCLISSLPLAAQTDSTEIVIEDTFRYGADTVLITSYAKERFDPRKALLYSAVLPGLGQAYNKKYWKIPIVYGGFVAIGIGLDFYQDLYIDYKNQLFEVLREQRQLSSQGFSEDQLRPAIDRARRERDFMIILMAGMYVLQLIDAHVDAHLKEFKLNPNLRVQLQPTIDNNMLTGKQTGISLTFKF